MFTRSLTLVAVAALGGFLAGGLALPLSVRYDWFGAANLLNQLVDGREVITRVEERTVVVPKSDYFVEAIEKIQDSIVSVQAFRRMVSSKYFHSAA